jgi:CheY-like chemotaxis protein/signal transduction histidine kinase/CHASE3 domain sensor protein
VRKFSSQWKAVTACFFAAVALLSFNAWLMSSNLDTLRGHEQWVRHTYVVINELETILSLSKDVEAGERGYLLVHDDITGNRARTYIEETWKHLGEFKKLTSDNPNQLANANQLDAILKERFAFTQHLMAENTAKWSRTEAAAYIERARNFTSAMRRQVVLMEDEERGLLEVRTASSRASSNTVNLTLAVGTLFNLLLALFVFVLVRWQMLRQTTERNKIAHENWLKEGEAETTRLFVNHEQIPELSMELTKLITTTLKIPAANLFVLTDGFLELAAGYGKSNDSHAHGQKMSVQEGLFASVMRQTDLVHVPEVPSDYFKIRSGFGESVPTHLLFVPLRFQGKIVGVLEAAAFETPSADVQQWLRETSEVIGAGLATAQSRQRQQLLLEETQRQAEELQMQQEELRTNNEELEEQAKALLQSQERLQVQQEEMAQVNEELEQQARALESQQTVVNERNRDLEVSKRDVEMKAHELERANQYKSEFLAKMSHELRTPLNSLMILATLLQENKSGNLSDQQIDFARTIHEAGADLLNLINDILDLSKLEARKLAARPETFTLRSLFDQLATGFKPQIDEKGLGLQLHLDDALPERILTDRQRLQQILRNFISNALKFTEKGEIRISAESIDGAADRIRLIVADTGIGIPPEKKQLIFEAFEQADGSVSRKYGGTGLGLTISRELAHLLGGHIALESKDGEGSRFILEIPTDITKVAHAEIEATPLTPKMSGQVFAPAPGYAANEPQAPTAPPPRSQQAPKIMTPFVSENGEQAAHIQKILSALPKGDSKTILIVEDEATFRSSVAEAARAQGFTPLEAEDAETAMSILKLHIPKAIMLDIKLPGMSGLTLLETVKEMPNLRHVPIHMISALEYQQSALRMGAVGYLGKPVTIAGVRSALDRIESVISQRVKRLLIVEDDLKQRKAISELVGGQDIELVSVESGAAAILELQKSSIDCIILDLSLPDMSGFELLERLNEREGISLPPVIIYTGKDLSKDELERLRRYSDSIIIKGAKSPERLLDEVSLFLHRIETSLPAEKRAMLADLRLRDRHFEDKSILIVDDDLRNVFALTSALESKGFNISVARNGIEALEALDKIPHVDAVLMDIMMPKMDGFEAMKRIRANPKFKRLPIIALTAKTMKGEHERCVQAGASDYLPKPVNLMNLLSVLKVWLPPPEMLM